MLACWQTRSPAATAQHTAYSTLHAARSQHTHTQHTHCTAGSTAKGMFQVSAALAGIQKGPPGGPGGLWGHIWSFKRAPVFKLAKAQFHQILNNFCGVLEATGGTFNLSTELRYLSWQRRSFIRFWITFGIPGALLDPSQKHVSSFCAVGWDPKGTPKGALLVLKREPGA